MNTFISDKKDASSTLLIGNLIIVLVLQLVILFVEQEIGWYSYQGIISLLQLLLSVLPTLLVKSLAGMIFFVTTSAIAVGLFKLLHRLHKKPYALPKYHFSIICWLVSLLSSHIHPISVGLTVVGLTIFEVAYRKKMTGWIAVGSFCVFWLAIGFVGFMLAFANKDISIAPQATNLQTVQGLNDVYSIQIPADWKIERKTADDYDIFAYHRSFYLGVITEEADFGSSQVAAEQIQAGFKEKTTELKFGDKTSFILDGRTWVQFTVRCRFENIPIAYLVYVYSGSEGMFEVVAWTSQNLFDRDIKVMRELMQTFHFAKKPDAPVTVPLPPAKLTVKEAIVQFDIGRNHYLNKEYTEAYKLWVLAADANILEAYNNLGYLNYNGLGVKQNYEEGIRLWRIAAANGSPESQIHLSEAYADGESMEKDLIEAYAWAKTAIYFIPQEGDEAIQKTYKQETKDLIKQYSAKLSKTQIEQAENRAKAFISTISETLKSSKYIWRWPKLEPALPIPAIEYGVKNS